jgi:hypothetical protein
MKGSIYACYDGIQAMESDDMSSTNRLDAERPNVK